MSTDPGTPPMTAPIRRRLAARPLALALAAALFACGSPGDPLPRDVDSDTFDGDIGDMGDIGDPDMPLPDRGMPGEEGQPCRVDEPPCDGPLRCVDMRCALPQPGERDQPCRADDPRCEPGLRCDDEAVCRVDPDCPDPCDPGETVCAGQGMGEGYLVCGGRADGGCPLFGVDPDEPVIVQCDGDRTCEGGQCRSDDPEQPSHPSPEVALLVDRGIDLANWPEWRNALVEWVVSVQPAIAVGAQTFPGEGPCVLGPQARSSRNEAALVAGILDQPPPADLGRPLYTAMGHAIQLLGVPSEGQYVVLITTGSETCDEAQRFVRRVSTLRGRGIRTRIIRVVDGDAADDPILDAAGRAGGLAIAEDGAGYRDVASPSELRDALDALGRRTDAGCADLDDDGRGPFCPLGADCAPQEPASYVGGTEVCDGLDNDCDGAIDESVEADAPAADLTEGLCAGQTRECVDGLWVEPNYLVEVPGYEHSVELSCDRADNDCDGRTDEALGDRVGPCTVGLGACAGSGAFICDPERPMVSICDAVTSPPSPEACDLVDNDCDGEVDEDAPVGGIELCDGFDNDCDDAIDESPDLARCEAEAGQTALACRAGACALACAADRRDADLAPDCEAPGYGELGLGDGFTCLVDPLSGQPECYGRPDAPIPPAGEIERVVAGGRHACVLLGGDRAGEVRCAGPDATLSAASAGRYTALGIGDRIGCGLTPAGAVECWSPDAASAGLFGADRVAVHMAVGGRHVCAVDAEGTARCYGACGQGCQDQGAAPQRPRFVQLAAGAFHTCGLSAPLGYLYCWGAGRMPCAGALCGEQQGQSMAPEEPGYRAIAVGDLHSCAIAEDFSIRCWGLADGGRTNPPEGRFGAIWGGGDHMCARRFDGHVRCWGVDVGGETAPLD